MDTIQAKQPALPEEDWHIRTAAPGDLDAVTAIEAACFPPAEAADRSALAARLAAYPDHFWLLLAGDRPVGFVNGMATDQPDLTDEMYENAALHRASGAWQMIFGLDVLPEWRRQGCGARLLRHAIAAAHAQGRRGLVLTCKARLVPYYAGFGFVNEGVSGSVHGGVTWYQMRLTFLPPARG